MVRDECLTFALERGLKYGIWGGTSERERRVLRKQAA
jgi:WhiB family transcriptional regulator, redox-sensing transcriptional regulator